MAPPAYLLRILRQEPERRKGKVRKMKILLECCENKIMHMVPYDTLIYGYMGFQFDVEFHIQPITKLDSRFRGNDNSQNQLS